ncbi:unnamed protein product [Olea europaea subsp. europaea]|uniref:Unnamed protein product n=1 Tax=Olea europaea subsp. europaea TaxID=158383 RepID=A0A8S0QXY5_OLEEU|nr:unnamed protein product [Olea europaea subsp. europaea]
MYRSTSTNRVTDDRYNYHLSSSPSSSKGSSPALRALSLEANELPVYEPLSEAAKKERARAKFAENAIHIIPIVLLLCAFVLWFLSNPDIDVPVKENAIAAKIEGLTLEGEVDSDGTGQLPMELGDFDSAKIEDTKKSISDIIRSL